MMIRHATAKELVPSLPLWYSRGRRPYVTNAGYPCHECCLTIRRFHLAVRLVLGSVHVQLHFDLKNPSTVSPQAYKEPSILYRPGKGEQKNDLRKRKDHRDVTIVKRFGPSLGAYILFFFSFGFFADSNPRPRRAWLLGYLCSYHYTTKVCLPGR